MAVWSLLMTCNHDIDGQLQSFEQQMAEFIWLMEALAKKSLTIMHCL